MAVALMDEEGELCIQKFEAETVHKFGISPSDEHHLISELNAEKIWILKNAWGSSPIIIPGIHEEMLIEYIRGSYNMELATSYDAAVFHHVNLRERWNGIQVGRFRQMVPLRV